MEASRDLENFINFRADGTSADAASAKTNQATGQKDVKSDVYPPAQYSGGEPLSTEEVWMARDIREAQYPHTPTLNR